MARLVAAEEIEPAHRVGAHFRPDEHQPALDGLRGVAVAAVLLFHGGVSWVPGGYLGVSVFFTLSGFLITRLLMREVAATGTVRVGAFYARRARRLLPASLVCLVGVTLAGAVGVWDGVAHLQRDSLGALFQVANWVDLGSGRSYGDLLQAQAGRVPPLAHFWSLAVEEQFYWVWPMAIMALAYRRRAGTWSRTIVGATLVAAVAAPVVARVWGPDAAYWSTPARAAEILAGAALACLLAERRLGTPPRWLAPASLGALVLGVAALPATGGPAYQGGLPLVGLASAGLIWGLQSRGPVRSLLALPPLEGLGRVSYGVYLYHWPMYAWLDEGFTGVRGASLLALRLWATVAAALVSYVVIEQPVRGAAWRPSRTLWAAVPALGMAVLLAVVLAPKLQTDFAPDPLAAARVAIQPPSPEAGFDRVSLARRTPSRPIRIVVVGDSTALALGAGIVDWAGAHPDLAQVSVHAGQGCGFVRTGVVPTDPRDSWPQACERMFARLPDDLRIEQPDVVVLYMTSRDVDPRSWDGGPVLTIRDEAFRAHLRDDYRAVTDEILATTPATVVWVRSPVVDPYWKGSAEAFDNPEVHRLLDEARAEVVAAYPYRVELLDLRGWLEDAGLDLDQAVRPDGIHLAPAAAESITEQWLGRRLIEATRRMPPTAALALTPIPSVDDLAQRAAAGP